MNEEAHTTGRPHGWSLSHHGATMLPNTGDEPWRGLELLEPRLLLSGFGEPNDIMAMAYDLTGSLTAIHAEHRNLKASISAQVETVDDIDWYRFDLAVDSGIAIGFGGQIGASVSLVDEAGEPLSGPFINSGFASPAMPAGSYYLKVITNNPNQTPTYNMSVTVMPAVNLTELVTVDPLRPSVVAVSWDETIPANTRSYFTLDLEAGQVLDFDGVGDSWGLTPLGATTGYGQQKNEMGDLPVQYTDRYWYTISSPSTKSSQLHLDIALIEPIVETEPNDSAAQATALSEAQFGQMPGNPQRLRAYVYNTQDSAGDIDYFHMTARQGDYYWFSRAVEGAFYTDGSPIPWDSAGSLTHVWRPPAADTPMLLRMRPQTVGEGQVAYIERRMLNELEPNDDRGSAQNGMALLTDHGGLLSEHLVGNGVPYPTWDYDHYRLDLQAGDAVYFEQIYGSGETRALDAGQVWMPGQPSNWFIAPQAGDYYIYHAQNSGGAYDVFVAVQPSVHLNALLATNPQDPTEQVAALPGWTRHPGDPLEAYAVNVVSPSFYSFSGTSASILTDDWAAVEASSGLLLPGVYYFHRGQGGDAGFTLVPAEEVTAQLQSLGDGKRRLELMRTHSASLNYDLYQFTLATDQLVTALTRSYTGSSNVTLNLYDAAGNPTPSNYLPAGTYYLRVFTTHPTSYTVVMETNEAGDLNAELTVWPGDATRRHVLKQVRNAGDWPDLYRVTISERSFVWAELRDVQDATRPYGGSPALRLYAADGSYLAGSGSQGVSLIQRFLEAGDYYFEVPAADADLYLMLDEVMPRDEVEPNGSLTNPQIVDAFLQPVQPGIRHGFFSGHLGSGADSFAFDLQAGEMVHVKLHRQTVTPKMRLYDPAGQVVAYQWAGDYIFTHQAETAGRHVLILSENTSGTDDYVVDVWTYATDEIEPNDSTGQAMDLTGLFQVSPADSRLEEAHLVLGLHRTYPDNSSGSQVDYDYYKLHLEAGDLLTVRSAGPAYYGKLWNLISGVGRIAVHDASGTELHSVNGAMAPATLLNQWAAPLTGDYFIRMDRGSYSGALSLLEMTFEIRHPDDIEPNDSPAEATDLNGLLNADAFGTRTGQFVASIGQPGDHDYFRIDISEPGVIDIRGKKVGGNDSINSEILDSLGNVIRSSSFLSHPFVPLATPGTYYLHNWARSAGETYAYSFDVIFDPATPDTLEPNDLLAQAYDVTALLGPADAHGDRSATVMGNSLHLATDIDVFAVSADADDVLLATLPYQNNLHAQWLSPQGAWLPYVTALNDPSGIEHVRRSVAVAPQAGTHYLVIYTTQGSLTRDIDYDLTVHVGPLASPDDVLADGGGRIDEVSLAGTQSLTGTPDLHKVWLNAGQVVSATGDQALLIPHGAPGNDLYAATGPFSVASSGYYYLIASFNAAWTEHYALTLSVADPAVSETEPNDSPASAQPLPALSSFNRPLVIQAVAGEIGAAGEVDWFALDLSAGARSTLSLGSAAGAGPFVATVLDPQGDPWLTLGGSHQDQVQAVATLSGTYQVRVEGADGTQTGRYHLSVARHPAEQEPNDDTGSATDLMPLIADALALGVPVKLAATSVPGDDADLYHLHFAQPVKLHATTGDYQGRGTIPQAVLRDAAGNVLFGGDTRDVILSSGQSYYLDVTSDGFRYYELGVGVAPMETIAWEADPQNPGWQQAVWSYEYVSGANFAGLLIEPPAGSILLMDVNDPGNTATASLRVYDHLGQSLSSGGRSVHLASPAGAPLRVQVQDSVSPSPITVRLRAIPVAALALAQPNPNVAYAHGQFEATADENQIVAGFTFEVPAGAQYFLRSPAGSVGTMNLYRPDGQKTSATSGTMPGVYVIYWHFTGTPIPASMNLLVATPFETEPNHAQEQANVLDGLWAADGDLPGVERITAVAEITGSSDVDWYSTQLNAGDILRATAVHLPLTDGFATAIFDPAGQQIGTHSAIAETAGLYTIRVSRDFRTGPYEFRAIRSHSDEQFAEPNDTILAATSIDAQVTATGEADRVRFGYVRGYGSDFLSVTLQEDQVLGLTARRMAVLPQDAPGVGFRVFDSFGQQILNASEPLLSEMTWYVAANRTGAYTITLDDTPGYVLRLDVFATEDIAAQLPASDHREYAFTQALADVDHPRFYRFTSPGDEMLFAQVAASDGQSTPLVDLLDRSGQSVLNRRPLHQWQEGEISGYAVAPGDYYIAVAAPSANQLGSFELTISTDRREPLTGNDTPAAATDLDGTFASYGGPAGSTRAQVEAIHNGPTADRDVYAVTLEEGQVFTLRVEEVNYLGYSANGAFRYSVTGMGHTLLPETSFPFSTRIAVAPATGTYYIDALGDLSDGFVYRLHLEKHRGYVLDDDNATLDPLTGDRTWHVDFGETLNSPEAGFSIHHDDHTIIERRLNKLGGGVAVRTEGPYDAAGSQRFYLTDNQGVSADVLAQTAISVDGQFVDEGPFAYANPQASVHPGRTTWFHFGVLAGEMIDLALIMPFATAPQIDIRMMGAGFTEETRTPDPGYAAAKSVTVGQDGVLYVGVRSQDASAINVLLHINKGDAQEVEPNNSFASAQDVASVAPFHPHPDVASGEVWTTTVHGAIASAGDVDYWRLQAQAGEVLIVGAPGGNQVDLRVYGPDQTLRGHMDFDFGRGTVAAIPVAVTGTYYIAVSTHRFDLAPGPYELLMHRYAVEDWDGLLVEDNGAATFQDLRSAEFVLDLPVFRLTLDPGDVLTIGNNDDYVAVWDAQGHIVGQVVGGTLTRVPVWGSGVYYGVGAWTTSAVNLFASGQGTIVTVESRPQEMETENNNSAAQANALQGLGVTDDENPQVTRMGIYGRAQAGQDDFFSVPLQFGDVIQIDTDVVEDLGSPASIAVELRAPDGSIVMSRSGSDVYTDAYYVRTPGTYHVRVTGLAPGNYRLRASVNPLAAAELIDIGYGQSFQTPQFNGVYLRDSSTLRYAIDLLRGDALVLDPRTTVYFGAQHQPQMFVYDESGQVVSWFSGPRDADDPHDKRIIAPHDGRYHIVLSRTTPLDNYILLLATREAPAARPLQVAYLNFDGGFVGNDPLIGVDFGTLAAFDETLYNLADREALIDAILTRVEADFPDMALRVTPHRPEWGEYTQVYITATPPTTVGLSGYGATQRIDDTNYHQDDVVYIFGSEFVWNVPGSPAPDVRTIADPAERLDVVATTLANEISRRLGLSFGAYPLVEATSSLMGPDGQDLYPDLAWHDAMARLHQATAYQNAHETIARNLGLFTPGYRIEMPNDTPAGAMALPVEPTEGPATVWAGITPGDADYFAIVLSAGQPMLISTATTTPGGADVQLPDGADPLNPALVLYDPAGNPIALDSDSADDGLNALIQHTAAETGTYIVQVVAEAGQGEYFLSARTGAVLVPGDFNRDGQLTNTDIQAMLDALVNLAGYKADHALSDQDMVVIGDLDGNGAVSNTDIQALLDLLTSGGDSQAAHDVAPTASTEPQEQIAPRQVEPVAASMPPTLEQSVVLDEPEQIDDDLADTDVSMTQPLEHNMPQLLDAPAVLHADPEPPDITTSSRSINPQPQPEAEDRRAVATTLPTPTAKQPVVADVWNAWSSFMMSQPRHGKSVLLSDPGSGILKWLPQSDDPSHDRLSQPRESSAHAKFRRLRDRG